MCCLNDLISCLVSLSHVALFYRTMTSWQRRTLLMLLNSHHFMQSVEFTVAFLHSMLSAIHQHFNLEDLKGRRC